MENLSVFEKCKNIRKALLTRVGEMLCYNKWSDQFKVENMNDIFETLERWEEKYGIFKIDPNELTESEMKELGFGKWNEENSIRLIPIWLFPFLTDSFICGSIDGNDLKLRSKSELDNDHRFGYLAYGCNPKEDIKEKE